MVNIFAYTSPNRSGFGAMDNPDRFEQVFDTHDIPEASEKIFMDDISMVRPYKTYCTFLVVIRRLYAILLTITFTKGNLTLDLIQCENGCF